ncbi:uncharacterized protein LOC111309425 [Durio zibethinus]|uniref:Uncharacterized protein LOC111309425 n=1 Tax=Durio zibethinus TaxID=66656 RepID=A0A6P6AH67_DURZI|nr:uncharacterized protein LOC111309425 [Durio zibethinus]
MEGMMLGLIKAKRLYIRGCEELISSWQNQEGPSTHLRPIRFLEIHNCSGLVSIGAEDEKEEHMQLGIPCHIEHLSIQLESIAQEIEENSSLELITICSCDNLRSLPRVLNKLRKLAFLGVKNSMHCPSVMSFPEEGFPPNLTSFRILQPNIWKSVIEWGLHKLTSLKTFVHQRCFSRCGVIPIRGNASARCPKLKFLPEEMFDSLLQLEISRCPLLEERCKKDE